MEAIYEITGGDLIKFFGDSAGGDGLNVKFYHGANSKSEMNEALQGTLITILFINILVRESVIKTTLVGAGDYDMLEADISLSPDTNEPIMAHPPITISDNTLYEWFQSVTGSNKAIKMDIKSDEVIPSALNTLRQDLK